MCFGSFDIAIARRGVGHQRVQELLGDLGDPFDGAIERRFVGFGRVGEAAELSHELHCRRTDFIVRCRRSKVIEGLDISAHGQSITYRAGTWESSHSAGKGRAAIAAKMLGMNVFLRVLLPTAVAATLACAGVRADTTPPIRHLVFDFTYSNIMDTTMHDNSMDNGPVSGHTDSVGGGADRGELDVDVVSVQPDGGLIVGITEHGQVHNDTSATTCAVYGSTVVVCDPDRHVGEEEMALLRLLGNNFIDVSQIDAKNHWSVGSQSPDVKETDDFSIVGTNPDGTMKINETRVRKQTGASTANSSMSGNIVYNQTMSVPVKIVDDTMMSQELGAGNYSTQHLQLAINLVSDSKATQTP